MEIGNIIGKMLHEEWAQTTRNNGLTERWKPTGDEKIDQEMLNLQKEGKALPKNYRVVEGKVEIDILNTPFEELTEKWKGENLQAGIAAEKVVGATNATVFTKETNDIVKQLQNDERLEELSSMIHDEWMLRRENERKADPNAWIEENLMVPYVELTREEKDKDKAHVLKALTLVGSLQTYANFDYLKDRMYGDSMSMNNGIPNYPKNVVFATSFMKNMPKISAKDIECLKYLSSVDKDTIAFIEYCYQTQINKKTVKEPEMER